MSNDSNIKYEAYHKARCLKNAHTSYFNRFKHKYFIKHSRTTALNKTFLNNIIHCKFPVDILRRYTQM